MLKAILCEVVQMIIPCLGYQTTMWGYIYIYSGLLGMMT